MSDEKIYVDPDELAAAEAAVDPDKAVYIHKFSKPFKYQGRDILSVSFDFEKLTGKDALDIESELQRLGKSVIVPAFSGDYLIRMAARASNPVIGADAFSLMSLRDYNKIRNEARSFLLVSE